MAFEILVVSDSSPLLAVGPSDVSGSKLGRFVGRVTFVYTVGYTVYAVVQAFDTITGKDTVETKTIKILDQGLTYLGAPRSFILVDENGNQIGGPALTVQVIDAALSDPTKKVLVRIIDP